MVERQLERRWVVRSIVPDRKFNDARNTFYLRLSGVRHMVKDHKGYSFRLAARVLLDASSHRQECTYHSLCYTSRGSLAGTSVPDKIIPASNPQLNEIRTIIYEHITHFPI